LGVFPAGEGPLFCAAPHLPIHSPVRVNPRSRRRNRDGHHEIQTQAANADQSAMPSTASTVRDGRETALRQRPGPGVEVTSWESSPVCIDSTPYSTAAGTRLSC